jgi:hypothetical protein
MSFEDNYFDFDIAFQDLLEYNGLMDTLTMDTVKPNFDINKIKFNWREMGQVLTLDNQNLRVYIEAMKKEIDYNKRVDILNEAQKTSQIEHLKQVLFDILTRKEN